MHRLKTAVLISGHGSNLQALIDAAKQPDFPALSPVKSVVARGGSPVKGEVLRLRWRRGCMPLPRRVVRARVHGRQVYLVPRADGVVVGAHRSIGPGSGFRPLQELVAEA